MLEWLTNRRKVAALEAQLNEALEEKNEAIARLARYQDFTFLVGIEKTGEREITFTFVHCGQTTMLSVYASFDWRALRKALLE
jgi:hypothetical protein